MRSCDRFETGWDEADAAERSALSAHSESCLPCGEAAERQTAYGALLSVAARELKAGDDLPPDAWVRLRDGIDRGLERRQRRLSFATVLAGLGAAAAVLLLVGWPVGGGTNPEVERVATTTARSPQAVAMVESPEAPQAAVELAQGDAVHSGDAPRVVVAFERHVLTLAAHSSVQLVAWSPDGVELMLREGSVHCDVQRESEAEFFRVQTAEVTVSVLGTAFNVAVGSDGATQVDVDHGIVQVTQGAQVTRLTAEQSGRFVKGGGAEQPATPANEAGEESEEGQAAQGSAARAPVDPPASRSKTSVKVIEINVPNAAMDRPGAGASRAKPALNGPDKRSSTAKRKGDDVKLIDIVVPPQRDQNAPR